VAEAVVAKRYAEALIKLAKDDVERQRFEDDIAFILSTLKQDIRFSKVLNHPRIKKSDKLELIDKVWKPGICRTVYNFMRLLIEKRRIYELDFILKKYRIQMNIIKGIYVVRVHTAMPLEQAESEALRVKLEKMTGHKLEIKNRVHPEIIGGMMVRIGDDVIDWRYSRMLNDLNDLMRRNTLLGIFESDLADGRAEKIENL